ncbi:MAG: hypothetical protein P4M06_01740 [Pandoraea sp.]|nr:hypothetical protein [Pandoraea sp.]MDR3396264.1 hypothetical protein [Pandoraea sp.]
MRKRQWTPERLKELKERWETGMSAADLGHLYPDHTYRALETQALRVGARRPPKPSVTRQRMLRYLQRNVAVTTVDIATDLALQTGEVRKIINALHQERVVHIEAYRGVSPMYAQGAGEDMTRSQWAKVRKEKKVRSQPNSIPVEFHADWPKIIVIRAETGQHVPPRDPLIAAMYGNPVPDRNA